MKNELLFIFLFMIIFISGCTIRSNLEIPYDDNAIKLDNFLIQKQVRPEKTVFIDFSVVNQVENPVKNLDIKISNTGGFTIEKISCEDGTSNENGCSYDKLDSLDAKDISFLLRAPTREELGFVDPFESEITITVEYDYQGESIVVFPVLGYKETTERHMKIGQSHGPIHVDIKPGFLLKYEENGRTVTEKDWATKEVPFDIEVSVNNVGSLGSSYEYPNIELNSFEIELKNLKVDRSTENSCDLDGDTILTPKETISVPTELPLICTINPISDPGKITAKYSYRYKFIKKETITITEKTF